MNPGDKVEITTKTKSYTGRYLPSENKDITIIKLDNGYNIGIKDVKNIKIIEPYKSKQSKPSLKQNKNLPKISILHTGGTIASKIDYATGAAKHHFSPEELLALFPELNQLANINSRLVAQMWSEDMRFAHYNLLAKEVIKEAKSGAKGIIIGQGTDTIHYTAAALSFALDGLNIPVVIVGAQRSSDRGSSDAAMNVLAAANYILKASIPGVTTCLHENTDDTTCIILPGTKCRKMHSSRRDAFKPINASPIARIRTSGDIEILNSPKHYAKQTITLKPFKEDLKVGIAYCHPNMWPEEFKTYESFDGLIVAGTGFGNAPINKVDNFTKQHEIIAQTIKKLAKKIPVVATTQTIFGRVCLNVYSTGRKQQELGMIGNGLDLPPETAFIKLAWALSQKEDTKELYLKDIAGEHSESSQLDQFI